MAGGYAVPGYAHLQTARPQGTDLAAGQIDIQHVSPVLLAGLDKIAAALGQTITIFSGYRSSAYSASVGGFAGDPHTRGYAVDASVNGTPVGLFPGAVALIHQFGFGTGATDFTYNGKTDPSHVDLLGTSRSYDYAAKLAQGVSTVATTVAGWEQKVLTLIGAQSSAANIAFLDTWHQYELNSGTFNFLSTKQPEPGGSPITSGVSAGTGVYTYPSLDVGVAATAQTLQNGNYPDLLAALKSGNPTATPGVLANLKTWGSGTFASFLSGGGTPQGNDPNALYDPVTGQKVGQPTPSRLPGGSIATGSGIPNPIQTVDQVAGVLSGFFGKVTDVNFWLRVLQIIAGAILGFGGLFLLARQIGLAAPTVPGPSAAVAEAVS